MGIKQFDDDRIAKLTLANSTVKLGFFNSCIIENFNLPDGTEGSLWCYINFKKINTGRVNFYLYSTPNEDFPDKVLHQLYNGKEGEDSEEENGQEGEEKNGQESEEKKGQEKRHMSEDNVQLTH